MAIAFLRRLKGDSDAVEPEDAPCHNNEDLTKPFPPRSRTMGAAATSPWGRRFLVAVRVALTAVAAWALRRELAGVGRSELWRNLHRFDGRHLALGLGVTAAGFLLLGVVELMALRFAGRSVARSVPRRVALATSFVANAFSQSIGFALLTGPAVRLRAYSRGLDSAAITWVSAFVTATATLGLLATGAAALLGSAAPVKVAGALIAVRPAGALLALLVVAYLAWSAFGGSEEIGRGRWRVCRPLPAVAGAQVAISAIDWLLTGIVLLLLMPPSLSLPLAIFLRMYVVAQTVAVVSHVPAGLGVFEAVLMEQLVVEVPSVDRAELAASVVMFRALYYLAPLVAAMAVAGVSEMRRVRRSRLTKSEPAGGDVVSQTMMARSAHVD
ncbi:MAG: lysylphosphatidylglycerol synthase domain-containing protein [Gemmatimonadaceae bacterium]